VGGGAKGKKQDRKRLPYTLSAPCMKFQVGGGTAPPCLPLPTPITVRFNDLC